MAALYTFFIKYFLSLMVLPECLLLLIFLNYKRFHLFQAHPKFWTIPQLVQKAQEINVVEHKWVDYAHWWSSNGEGTKGASFIIYYFFLFIWQRSVIQLPPKKRCRWVDLSGGFDMGERSGRLASLLNGCDRQSKYLEKELLWPPKKSCIQDHDFNWNYIG